MGAILQRMITDVKKHAVVIPAYNERENIVLLVTNILDLGMGSRAKSH
jgi:hypothetical protein